MGIENRPYIGSWRLGQQELVQITPDALVYINGDTAVPGCPKCNGRIDIQQFVTEVSVEAGCDPAAASASFTLSIPVHHHDSFARDAKFILRPGLEVHIYYRGYFPVRGLYSNLAEPKFKGRVTTSGRAFKTGSGVDPKAADWKLPSERTRKRGRGIKRWKRGQRSTNRLILHESAGGRDPKKALDSLEMGFLAKGTAVHTAVSGVDGNVRVTKYAEDHEMVSHTPLMNDRTIAIETVTPYYGDRAAPQQDVINAAWAHKRKGVKGIPQYAVPPKVMLEEIYRQTMKKCDDNNIPKVYLGAEGNTFHMKPTKKTKDESIGGIASHQQTGTGHADGSFPTLFGEIRQRGYTAEEAYREANTAAMLAGADGVAALPPRKSKPLWSDDPSIPEETNIGTEDRRDVVGVATMRTAAGKHETELDREISAGVNDPVGSMDREVWEKDLAELAAEGKEDNLADPEMGPSMLAESGLAGFDIEKILAYPYYHVFRGVVVDVSISWSGGVQTVTIQCASLLHFWEYHQISTNASWMGARPLNSKLKTSLIGHNYTGMHPYEIMYTLQHDTAGSAGGVAWALSRKTNQRARGPIGGESLFSLNVKYWEKRFSTKEQKLRMHGASGDLFSAAQAAFLGQTDSTVLTRMIRDRYGDLRGKKGRRNRILQGSVSGRLIDYKALEALVVGQVRGGFGSNPSQFELNVIEMQAFVRNLGEQGQLNMMQSTYESKMDIAQQVMKVTGFEFYQDVDGDLVFKPPMYNLDTSASRTYRIEDIDIINISFSEKEPQVTYMTCKGSQIKGLTGHGMENEWGVQGQYIDYRLVAQFGWRPGDMETAYFNNPKAMFFAAVSRMDVLNAPMNSASVTIPLRPEMRPGYPVFIPYLDCYYYCNNFSHSFSVGGQCTTNLQLIAKRAKFYAPGRMGSAGESSGIEDIDLSNTILPERPLEVLDAANRPRLAGFPNVVMALDPEEINPMFFVVGSDIDVIEDPSTLDNLVRKAVELHILEPTDQDGVYIMSYGENDDVRFWFRSPRDEAINPSQGSVTAPSGAVDIQAAAIEYTKRKQTQLKGQKGQRSELTKVNSQIDTAQKQIRNSKQSLSNSNLTEKQQKKNRADLAKAQSNEQHLVAKRDALEQRYKQQRFAFEQELDSEEKIGLAYLRTLINATGEMYIQSNKNDGSRYGDTSSTVNLLDMLSDKKAIFSNGSTPGTYRYYSASHPDKDQQGQLMPVFRVKEDQDDKSIEYNKPTLEAIWQNQTVTGFVRSDQIVRPPGSSKRPEAQLRPIQPEWGIRVLTHNPLAPRGEVVPTSEIRELMFAVHRTDLRRKMTNSRRRNQNQNFEGRLRKALGVSALGWAKKQDPGTASTINDVFEIWFNVTLEIARQSVESSKEQAPGQQDQVPDFEILPTPEQITVGGANLYTDLPVGDTFRFSDTPQDRGEAYPGSGKQTLTQFWNRAAVAYAKTAYNEFHAARKRWYDELLSKGFLIENAQAVASAFNEAFGGAYKAKARSKGKGKGRRKPSIQKDIASPVFPVSDDKGYTVIGSYRYGRGVNIDGEGVFDVIHNQDPAQLLDKHTVNKLLDVIIRRRSITVEEVVGTAKNGSPIIIRRQAAGADALNKLEEEVLRQLRGQLSDKQILDLGIARRTADPDILKMDLINWFAEKGREGIQKTPVNNAAYSLADMQLHTRKNICSCKAAEASIMLDAAGQDGFVTFIEPGAAIPRGFGTGNEDRATNWLVNQAASVSVKWHLSQEALRGKILDKREGSIIQATQNLDFSRAMRDVHVLEQQVAKQGQQVETKAERIATDAKDTAVEFAEDVEDFLT